MQQSLSFQTLYLGLSPYESLAIYSLLPYVEIAGGIFYPMGGMFQLALALERLARELGVTFRYGARVERFETAGDTVRSVLLADGSRVTSDIVVANSDLPYTYDELLQDPYPGIEQKRFACSVVLMYIGTNRTWPHLQHHNFVVGRDMKTGCDDLFVRHRMPEDPAVLRGRHLAHRSRARHRRGREPLRAGAGAEPAGTPQRLGRLERGGSARGAADARSAWRQRSA